jgi:hypothetical protein
MASFTDAWVGEGTMKRAAPAMALVMALSGCTPNYSSTLAATPHQSVRSQQSVRYSRGTPTLTSIKEHGAVGISPVYSQFRGRFAIAIVAANRGTRPANLGYENISIRGPNGAAVRTFTQDDLKRQARNKAAVSTLAISPGAGYSTTSGSVNTGYGYATYSETTYNSVAANDAERRADEEAAAAFDEVRNQLNADLARLNGRILRTTTIDPGDSAGGEIVAAKPETGKSGSANVVVEVDFNGDHHTFTLAMRHS